MSKRFQKSGQGVYEYVLILVPIFIVAIAALTATGGQVNNILGHVTSRPPNKRWVPLQIAGDHLISGTDNISAINVKTGEVAWKTKHVSWFEGIIADSDTVYFTGDCYLTALSATTGVVKYKIKLPSVTKEKYRYVGPLLSRQGSYLIASKSNNIACYHSQSCRLIYTWTSKNSIDQASPTRFSFETTSKHIYVNARKSLVCLELATGKEMWRRKDLRSLGISTTKPATAIAFHTVVKSIVGLSHQGDYLWYHSISNQESNLYEYTRTVAAQDDILFIYSFKEKAYLDSINAKTGHLNWRYGPFPGDKALSLSNFRHLYTSRPVVSSTNAYFYDSDGKIHQVNLLSGKGSVIASFTSIPSNCINTWIAGQYTTKLRNIGFPISDITIKSDILYLSSHLPGFGKLGYHAFDTKKQHILWTSALEY